MSPEQTADIRTLARETYVKTRINRPHMPHPDTDDGQRKIDRLFDIMVSALARPEAKPLENTEDGVTPKQQSSTDCRPLCRKCGLEDGACICAHLEPAFTRPVSSTDGGGA